VGAAILAVQVAGQGRPDSVVGGWKVFAGKHCLECHAVWGVGGELGPDLGRTERETLTAGDLVGTMWNHVPEVQSYMLRNQIAFPRLDEREMSDLFSFLFFVRYLDEPGDPIAGAVVLRQKGCAECHAIEGPRLSGAPDLQRWAGFTNPIVWAQKMWEHAPRMEEAMRERGITWPRLEDTDLTNLVAYLRSLGVRETKVYLEPGSVERGARLFIDRGCRTCHYPGGPGGDLAATTAPRSLATLAARMWNHSPEMTREMQRRGVARSPLSAQEMADIVAHLVSLRYRVRGGDPTRGRAVFDRKLCVQCHGEDRANSSTAPPLDELVAIADPVRLAPAMWNHGVTMIEQMSRIGDVWPVFETGEMTDLIAYFRSVAPVADAAPAVTRVAHETNLPRLRPARIEPGATCVNSACHSGLVSGQAVHAPAAQGECRACHALVDPGEHTFEYVAADAGLCYECHDQPTDTMNAHGRVALGVCTACHNPHSAENLYGPGFTGGEVCFADLMGQTVSLEVLFEGRSDQGLPVPTVLRGTGTWEPAVADVPPEAVAPTPRELDLPPIVRPPPVAAPTPGAISIERGAISIEEGCVTASCHGDLLFGAFKHGPSAQHQCEVCHRIADETEHRFDLLAPQPDLCYECHDRPADAPHAHGPVALGLCSVCHDPHSSANEFMLPEAGNDLCFMCHSEMERHVRSSSVGHQVIEERGCIACHDAHQADHRFQLEAEVSRLCVGCHESVGEVVASATVPHEPAVTGGTCVNCHDPHGSNVAAILIDEEMNLCLGCHDRTMDTRDGTIVDMKSWIEVNPEHHGPIRNSTCTPCHQPHGSDQFRILRHEFPREFYRPFALETYELCFTCHEKTIVLDERTTTLTDFRNGDKNLHYIHVNREKGRTCRACHEIHAGTKPKRIKDMVPFGKWAYPVNFEMTEYGGSCLPGCHTLRAYDRRKEIIQD
jgi:predicted CXXCH cytochrome family protein